MDYETVIVVTQRDTTTLLDPLPTGPVLELNPVIGGLPGAKGDKGDKGTDGAASIPDVLDGGNF